MDAASQVRAIIQEDPLRWRLLSVVRALGLPDCWIGAGFVRNAVWDHRHCRSPAAPDGDVDVIWYDRGSTDPSEDRKYEAALRVVEPSVAWSVKNQARMHRRNGDAPYASAVEAMRFWPETATAIAARRNDRDECEIAAPFGLDDLLGLVLRPTPRFAHEEHPIYKERLRTKRWTTRWPLLKEAEA
jgi:hypothetical protein